MFYKVVIIIPNGCRILHQADGELLNISNHLACIDWSPIFWPFFAVLTWRLGWHSASYRKMAVCILVPPGRPWVPWAYLIYFLYPQWLAHSRPSNIFIEFDLVWQSQVRKTNWVGHWASAKCRVVSTLPCVPPNNHPRSCDSCQLTEEAELLVKWLGQGHTARKGAQDSLREKLFLKRWVFHSVWQVDAGAGWQ